MQSHSICTNIFPIKNFQFFSWNQSYQYLFSVKSQHFHGGLASPLPHLYSSRKKWISNWGAGDNQNTHYIPLEPDIQLFDIRPDINLSVSDQRLKICVNPDIQLYIRLDRILHICFKEKKYLYSSYFGKKKLEKLQRYILCILITAPPLRQKVYIPQKRGV